MTQVSVIGAPVHGSLHIHHKVECQIQYLHLLISMLFRAGCCTCMNFSLFSAGIRQEQRQPKRLPTYSSSPSVLAFLPLYGNTQLSRASMPFMAASLSWLAVLLCIRMDSSSLTYCLLPSNSLTFLRRSNTHLQQATCGKVVALSLSNFRSRRWKGRLQYMTRKVLVMPKQQSAKTSVVTGCERR